MKSCASLVLLALGVLATTSARADDFAPGSLVIPMDTDYQDDGTFEAFGLVYQLLLADVPVRWTIRVGKGIGEADFTASAEDVVSGDVVTDHGYRAGPFVVDSADATAAIAVIDTWHDTYETTVHRATTAFSVDVAEYLVSAPTIAMFADGREDIARGYLLAAGIPDSTGDLDWPDDSPDMLSIEEVSGPTDTEHDDGALFDDEGVPVYCQLMSMHWGVNTAEDNPEVVAEVRQFLHYPVHFFAERQAVNAFENSVHGHFLTPYGFMIDNLGNGDPVDFYHADSPFAQLDGEYELVSGSERSYTPCGNPECTEPGPYLEGGVVMITGAGTPEGIQDVWMTGYLDGSCPPDAKDCEVEGYSLGKISYLGGHEYDTDVPVSDNPRSVGARLFLQSLFEAPCATEDGQPVIELTKIAPTLTEDGELTYTIAYHNTGRSVALDAVIRDPLPDGTTFVSASDGGTELDGLVTWSVGNIAPDGDGEVTITVTIDTLGAVVENEAAMSYRVGLNAREVRSNRTTSSYDTDRDGDGVGDGVDICPDDANPAQDNDTDPDNCGGCGNACASGACAGGMCVVDGDSDADTGGDVGTDADAGDDTGDDGDTGADTEPDGGVDAPDGADDAGEGDTTDDSADDAGTEDTDDSETTPDGADASGSGDSDADSDDGSGGTGTDSGCGCGVTPTRAGSSYIMLALVLATLRRRRTRS